MDRQSRLSTEDQSMNGDGVMVALMGFLVLIAWRVYR